MWRHESTPADGDNGECCDRVLNQIIPCLVDVLLVISGVYLVRDVPQHNMFKMRMDSIQGCLGCLGCWSKSTGWDSEGKQRSNDQMKILNVACNNTALETCHRRSDEKMMIKLNAVLEENEELRNWMDAVSSLVENHPNQEIQTQASLTTQQQFGSSGWWWKGGHTCAKSCATSLARRAKDKQHFHQTGLISHPFWRQWMLLFFHLSMNG